jgi:N-methylhydantoinase A
LIQTFNDEHKREYGYTMPSHIAHVEIANVRMAAVGNVDKPHIAHSLSQGEPSPPGSEREVYFTLHGFVRTPVYWRDALTQKQTVTGPAIVEQADSTTVIAPGWQAASDAVGNLRLTGIPPVI